MQRIQPFAALAALLLAATSAFASTWTDGSGHVWAYDGGTVTNLAISSDTTTIVMPSTLGGNTVSAFKKGVFAGKTRVVRVTIPSTVTSIPEEAFLNCSNLKSVTIQGQGLRKIHDFAFKGCVNLQSFIIPDSVTVLGQGVFSGCSNMTSVTIGNGIELLTGVHFKYVYGIPFYDDNENSTALSSRYENGLFYNCTSLETINWGANVREIGNIAFLNCSSLEEVEIPNTVTNIGHHAFLGCETLESVTIGNGVKTVGCGAFRALPSLQTVVFGSQVVRIGQQAFQDCVNLHNFELPSTIQYIDYRAFAGCSRALTSVTIPTNIAREDTELGQGVFSGCSKLETVTLGDTVKTLTSVHFEYEYGIHYYDDNENSTALSSRYDNGFFYNCTSLKTINWGTGIQTIGNIAFLNCSALESVTIPDTVTTIGNHAFLGCDNLGTVNIGNKVTDIGRMAFRALPNLTTVTFGRRVEQIGGQAFQDCVNLRNFILPETIYQIGYRAFAGCDKALTSATIPTNVDGIDTDLGEGVFSGCSKLETVTLGDTVKTLTSVHFEYEYGIHYYDDNENSTALGSRYDNGFFYNCKSLKTINWGSGIKTIGNIAFLNCSALESVTIPNTVTTIGNHAFLGCDSLATVIIGNKVTEIGRMAFRDLPNLTEVTFGKKVKRIGSQAFQDCANLRNFTLPDTIQFISYRAFAGCNNALTSVVIPTNVSGSDTELGEGVFSGCSKLETVTLGDTVKTLTSVLFEYEYGMHYYDDNENSTDLSSRYDNGFFYNCKSLKTINLGTGIQTIGNIAFLNCSALESVTIPDTVTSIGNHAFWGCSSLGTIVVEGRITEIGRRAFGNCPALHYVDFRGAAMDFDPGVGVFDFDKADMAVYVAAGSTGWTGVADVEGLPEDGTWCGVRIAYGPPPAGADAPYDFRPFVPTTRVSYTDTDWPSAVLLTPRPYVHNSTNPRERFLNGSGYATFYRGERLYLSYAFDEYWRGLSFDTTNTVHLFKYAGESTGWIYVDSAEFPFGTGANASTDCFWQTNAVIPLLQGLEPGVYEIDLFLNTDLVGDALLPETCSTNNTAWSVFFVDERSVTVSLDDGYYGTGGCGSVTATCGYGLPKVAVPKRAGYRFQGYYSGSYGTGTRYYDATGTGVRTWDVTDDTTLHAYWTEITYAVRFHANGGKGSMADQTFYYNRSQTLSYNRFTRADHAFAGWAESASATSPKFANGQSIYVQTTFTGSTINLYAIWRPTTYTVKFVANGGSGSMSAQKVSVGATAKLAANRFTRSGWVFLGWAKSKGGAVAFKNGASARNFAAAGKTATLYAVWAKKDYKVQFVANGGKGKMPVQKMTWGKAAKLKANKFQAPKGKKFAGWATSKANAKKGKVAYKNKKAVKNLTTTGKTVKLYAVWKKK